MNDRLRRMKKNRGIRRVVKRRKNGMGEKVIFKKLKGL